MDDFLHVSIIQQSIAYVWQQIALFTYYYCL